MTGVQTCALPIYQQAKYRIYENVYAAILIIGFIGLSTDMVLAWIGRNVFVWTGGRRNTFFQIVFETFTGSRDTTFTFLKNRDTRYEHADTAQL